jgi:hypothetical protein
MDGYLSKPIQRSDLVRVLRARCSLSEPASSDDRFKTPAAV